MAEYNKVYASLKPELPKVIQQEQIYVYAPRSSRSGMKSISSFNITAPVASVQYDTTDGITVTGNSSLVSEEMSGEIATQNFQSEFRIPIRPGKYINIDATTDNKKIEVKVDDTALALDYIKIDKTALNYVPWWNNGVIKEMGVSQNADGGFLALRLPNGQLRMTECMTNTFSTTSGDNKVDFYAIYSNTAGTEYSIDKTATDTGTLTTTQLSQLYGTVQGNNRRIIYDGQAYVRMDPVNAPDGTLNYIHLDSIEDGNGVYKATGKCFSVNVSTRAWKVFDLEFGGSGSGNGIEQINKWTNGTVTGVTYDTNNGAKVTQTTTVDYTDSTDGSTKQQQFGTTTTLPIVPGKYISMNATSDNKKMEVKVDDTALAQDYIKLDKTSFNYIPWWYNGTLKQLAASTGADGGLLAVRLPAGQLRMTECMANTFSTTSGDNKVDFYAIYSNTAGTEYSIDKTATDTGTLTTTQLSQLYGTVQGNNRRIIYDGQAYVRMDPTNAPDGTLNYIHLDSIEDGNGGYKATGKCFSITISTRAWQVFDLDFGGSTRTTHNLALTNSSTGTTIYFSLTNNRTETYEGAPAGLLTALENTTIACTVDANGTYSAGMITTDGTNFQVTYGNGEQVLIDQMQVSIADNIV